MSCKSINSKFPFIICENSCYSLFVSFYFCFFLFVRQPMQNELRLELFRNHEQVVKFFLICFNSFVPSFTYLNQAAETNFLCLLKDCPQKSLNLKHFQMLFGSLDASSMKPFFFLIFPISSHFLHLFTLNTTIFYVLVKQDILIFISLGLLLNGRDVNHF